MDNAEQTQKQFDGIGLRFDKGFDEIKNLMRSFDDRIRAIELREASCQPMLDARIGNTERTLIAHKSDLLEMRQMIQKQTDMVEALNSVINTISGWGRWIANIVTALVTSGLLFFIGRLIYLAVVRDVQ